MPTRARRACGWPGCPELTAGQFCQQHSQQQQQEIDAARGSASSRGYDYRWKKIRAMQLARFPLCKDPYGRHRQHGGIVPANEVDHIVPLSQGGSNSFDNLQSLCKTCHSIKTAREDHRWG